MSNNITIPAQGSSGTTNPVVETLDSTGSSGPQRQFVSLRSGLQGDTNDVIGPTNDSAASSDTATASINARLQRVAQNITTANSNLGTINTSVEAVVTAVEAALKANLYVGGTVVSGGNQVPVSGTFWQTTQPVSLASLPALVAGSALIGAVNLDVGGSALALGQATKANGLPVTLPSDVTSSVLVTPTVTASAYTTGNEVGGLMTFANAIGAAGGGVLESISITSKSVQTTGLKLYVFGTNPSNSTWTDKSAPAINAADLPYLLGQYTLGAADSSLGTMTVWNLDRIGKSLRASGTSLYGVLVAVGTPTFASTSDVAVTITTTKD